MAKPQVLQSYIGGRWLGEEAAQKLSSALDGSAVAYTHAESIDFGEAVAYARTQGFKSLIALDFQDRAARLKELCDALRGIRGVHQLQLVTTTALLPPLHELDEEDEAAGEVGTAEKEVAA